MLNVPMAYILCPYGDLNLLMPIIECKNNIIFNLIIELNDVAVFGRQTLVGSYAQVRFSAGSSIKKSPYPHSQNIMNIRRSVSPGGSSSDDLGFLTLKGVRGTISSNIIHAKPA
ncbi:hypothetical protein RF11_05792 [Thelohanellus kitauei]|uniref:Uncharacterized protein n=1 Tax=Thelohanellus kitauei TaxID=669202 RepID=A0A0C2M1Z6_THEKT|nr:hypothetical protein RF11_05792 [Thelohanellus kitauei]